MLRHSVILALIFFMLLQAGYSIAEPGDFPARVLYDLKQGNRRFYADKQIHPRQDKEQRIKSLPAQSPRAVVLACADSRVPVESVFDQGIGDLLVLRVPGNTAGRDVQIGVWFAVSKLNVPLVVVLGHSDCNAVNSVIHGEGHSLLPDIAKVFKQVVAGEGTSKLREYQLKRLVIKNNVVNSVNNLLETQPGLLELIASDQLQVVGAVYDLENGKVEWLDK